MTNKDRVRGQEFLIMKVEQESSLQIFSLWTFTSPSSQMDVTTLPDKKKKKNPGWPSPSQNKNQKHPTNKQNFFF